MDENEIKYYLNKVPVEIREAVMELNTPQKWAVYIALTVDGDKYFNQIKNQFELNPKTINDVLKSLVASGLVSKRVKQLVDVGDTNKTYYSTTKFGDKLLMNLYEVVLPPLDIDEIQSSSIFIEKPQIEEIELIRSTAQNFIKIPIPLQNLEVQFEGAKT